MLKRSLTAFVLLVSCALAQTRHETALDAGWRSVAEDTGAEKFPGAEQVGFDDAAWARIDVPHNWDDYGGVHRLVHGNLHGVAWYRREFVVDAAEKGRRVFLYFEGVGSYATVWVNGKPAGKHAGGRTTFTLDVTDLVNIGGKNILAVRADHPADIKDLPWVCGGCSTAPGFSEGSQPMGIFRPVQLVTTAPVRVEPFGVHVWNDADATVERTVVHVETEVKNYGAAAARVTLETSLRAPDGKIVATLRAEKVLAPGELATLRQDSAALAGVQLWSLEMPALYSVESTVREGGTERDRVATTFGIRTIQWPDPNGPEGVPFRLNGKPVFINGTCEYEHVLGASHAFSTEQIRTRVEQVRAAGFNAFRDAHQPHNLRYQEYWDRDGLLWWPQFVAQIWYDTPEFRANFKTLLRDWVRERRNNPSNVLWGLANESKLPPEFAKECVALIRELDPTASGQRLITTCNSGKGTDWNVPQNWSGTYGGDPEKYAEELKKQRLIGEYGAWRSLGLHTEGGFSRDGALSEDRFAALMERKIFLGESVRNESAGQFHWLLATHDNPGRIINAKQQQGSDGWAELDRVGPANNKGLLTLWGEPTDAYYLYRANYVAAAKDPMVYLVSHTWPDRWSEPGKKSGVVVYSNCDEVELFNDVGGASLGVRKRGPVGTHFQWDDVDVKYNVLVAVGRVSGKVVARDAIVLKNLPEAPHRRALNGDVKTLTAAERGWNYLYRVNCGGSDFVDTNGQRWSADHDFAEGDPWGARSWGGEYDDVPERFGSQREMSDAVVGTNDEALFQTYRYGREKLSYRFKVPQTAADYRVELFFTEPWYGRGGGDCTGWRLFDVAVNGGTVLRDLDVWKESGGSAHALKKVVTARAKGGWLEISFPRVASYEAVISGIAIATTDLQAKTPAMPAQSAAKRALAKRSTVQGTGGEVYTATKTQLTGGKMENGVAQLAAPAGGTATWSIAAGLGGAHDVTLRYASNAAVTLEIKIVMPDGTVVDTKTWTAPTTGGALGASAPDGGLSFNAGNYTAVLTKTGAGAVTIEALVVR